MWRRNEFDWTCFCSSQTMPVIKTFWNITVLLTTEALAVLAIYTISDNWPNCTSCPSTKRVYFPFWTTHSLINYIYIYKYVNFDTKLFTKFHRYPKHLRRRVSGYAWFQISDAKQMRPAIFAGHFQAFLQQRWTCYLVKWTQKKEISIKAETCRQRQNCYMYTKKKLPHWNVYICC